MAKVLKVNTTCKRELSSCACRSDISSHEILAYPSAEPHASFFNSASSLAIALLYCHFRLC